MSSFLDLTLYVLTVDRIYMKDKNGRLNGILLENAGIALLEKAFDPNTYRQLEPLALQGLKYGLEKLAKNGITSVVDARCYWTRKHDLAWEAALKQNQLTAKAILSLWAYPQFGDVEQINE